MTAPLHLTERCLECEHPVSAQSPARLADAMAAHVAYVNSQLDRTVDVHFALQRLTSLVIQ